MQDSIVAPQAKRSHTSQAQILSLLKKFNSQDKLTLTQFCRKHEIHRTNFYAWQKRHSKKDEGSNAKGFVSVEVAPPGSPARLSEDPMLFAEVNGIRLFHFVSPDYLKALLP
jgi:phage terminase small subunit